MATQRELIQSVKNILRGGIQADDDAISDRQIAFLIDAARATLLRQQYNKGQNLSENNIKLEANYIFLHLKKWGSHYRVCL